MPFMWTSFPLKAFYLKSFFDLAFDDNKMVLSSFVLLFQRNAMLISIRGEIAWQSGATMYEKIPPSWGIPSRFISWSCAISTFSMDPWREDSSWDYKLYGNFYLPFLRAINRPNNHKLPSHPFALFFYSYLSHKSNIHFQFFFACFWWLGSWTCLTDKRWRSSSSREIHFILSKQKQFESLTLSSRARQNL